MFLLRADITTVYRSTLFPFPLERLFEALPEEGWIVPPWTRTEGGLQMSASPQLGACSMEFSVDRRAWTIRGPAMDETVKAKGVVDRKIAAMFKLSPEHAIDFVEMRLTGSARGEKSPVEAFANYWSKNAPELQVPFSFPGLEALRPYGLRFAAPRIDPNRPVWGELTIAPNPALGTSEYSFDLIYRHSTESEVIECAKRSADFVQKTIESIEATK